MDQQRRRPVVVCGPSGVGKGTLLGRLMADYPDEFGFSVSHTTRQPRPGEQDGVDYHYRDLEELRASVQEGLETTAAEAGVLAAARYHPRPDVAGPAPY